MPGFWFAEAVGELEGLGFYSQLLGVKSYNLGRLGSNGDGGKVETVKKVLEKLGYPYCRRVAGEQGNFRKKDFQKWLCEADREALATALTRLVQLNQTKVYLFWKKNWLLEYLNH